MQENNMNESSFAIDTLLSSLQPIRNLAQNFDIDITTCLEEYLQELLQDLPPDEQNRVAAAQKEAIGTSLNFAQAAIVLQNSSLVYSRKVEYLHSLVYKALEEIASTAGGSNKRRSPRRSSQDADVEEFFNAIEDNQEFLLLDDLIPTDTSENNSKISLRDADADPVFRRSDASLRTSLSRSRLSMTALTSTSDRTNANNSSDVMMTEAQHRALTGALSETSLRLVDVNSNIDRASGSLLMPGVLAPTLNDGDTAQQQQQQITTNNPNLDAGGYATSSSNENYNSQDDGDEFVGNMGDYDDHEDDNDGPGFMMADDNSEANAAADNNGADEPTLQQQQQQPKRVTFADNLPEEEDDPWEMWDPHSSDGKAKDRPLRIGNTLRLPPGLNELPSECVTGARTKLSSRHNAWRNTEALTNHASSSSLAAETFKATVAARKRMYNEDSRLHNDVENDILAVALPLVPLKGLAFGEEFAYIAKETARRRAAERRVLRKQQQQLQRQQQQAAAAAAAANPMMNTDEDDDYDDGGGYAYGGYDDGDDDDCGGDNGGAPFVGDNFLGNTGMASLDDAYQGLNEKDDDVATGEQTFEELCRAHIRAFAKGAEKYKAETQLSKRVCHWQDRLRPILEEEEQRGPFDIHISGENLILSVQRELERAAVKNGDDADMEMKKGVQFGLVTRNMQHYEVCRMFLATLSLCNGGNVAISQDTQADINSLSIQLLQADIDRPMENYLAPSVLGTD